jgi:hypothetical protein
MDLGRLGGDRQELCQTLKNALQALWGRGFRFSVGLYASGWRWAAFPQGWGLGAGNFNPFFDAVPSSEFSQDHAVGAADYSCDLEARGLRGFFAGRLPGLSCQRSALASRRAWIAGG